MKLFHNLIGLSCLLLMVAEAAAASAPAPKLECVQPVFNFGERESYGEVEHTFTIHNSGDLTLQIFSVRPTCGCLVPGITDRLVPPGGETSITVRFALHGREGTQNKVVFVESNDPNNPSFALHLEGQIVDPVTIDPRLLFFGRIAAQAAVTGSLAVAAVGTNVLGTVTAQLDSPAFVVTAEPTVSNRIVRLVITSKPPLPEGLTRATLRITTGNPRVPVLTTVVSAFVTGAFSMSPPELILVGHEGEHVRREIIVRSESNVAFRVLAIEPPLKAIASTITPTNSATYHIEFPSFPVTRALEGQSVRILTDHPTHPEILVPIRVFLR